MPFGISQTQTDCSGWATVKQEADGTYTTIGCHETKQGAIDQMVVVSLAEDMEPLGDVGTRELIDVMMPDAPEAESEDEAIVEVDSEDVLEVMGETGLPARDAALYEAYEQIAEEFGLWSQTDAHYMAESPFAADGMQCLNCSLFVGGGRCEIVEGEIAAGGLCKLWVIKPALLASVDGEAAGSLSAARTAATPTAVTVRMRVAQPAAQRAEPDLSAPAFMRSSAKRGLSLHEQGLSGDGLKPATVADARKMAAGQISEAKWRKIAPWIARHIVDLEAVEGDEVTAGLVAMLLWGGGSSVQTARRAQRYAERIVAQLDEQRAAAPPKDQIFGSDKNPAGSAADKDGGIELDEKTETALQTKADEHNARMAEEKRPDWTRVRVSALRSVWRRGAGAFSTSHRPNVTRAQWAMARVNAFLYLAEKGRAKNPNYVGDNDLLDSDHPKFSKAGSVARARKFLVGSSLDDVEVDMSTVEWVTKQVDERRYVAYSNLEVRAADDGTKLIGYAAVFDSPSEPMPFTEFVRRGAFTKTLNDGADVRLLVDHEGVPLARTKSGTLVLEEDDRGLRVEADLDPTNPDAARIISAMRRGDLSQMSFAFRTIKDAWNNDRSVRELREVQLFDVSVVTFPAYEETVAELRGRIDADTVSRTSRGRLLASELRIAKTRRS